MTRIDLVYTNAGGGHRSSAEALRAVLSDQTVWETRLVNVQELLRPLDRVYRLTGARLEDCYNFVLRKNWTWGGSLVLPLLHAAIRHSHPYQVDLLTRHWRESRPDLVVSLVPHFNRAIGESLRRALPGTPLAVILTDFADVPPHFWIEPQEQFVVCGSERAAGQALAAGLPPRCIYRTSGMIVHPRFYEPQPANRQTERERLGLDPHLPTGLVMFGGEGGEAMAGIAARVARSGIQQQLIFLCGRNSKLAERLRQDHPHLRRLVVAYTTDVPRLMHLSDFFIGKPGPGSMSEALVMNLPLIVERSARTMPQERYNAEWVLEKQVGVVIPSSRRINQAIGELMLGERLSELRARIAALRNRAVFEIPGILHEIVQSSRRSLAS